MTPQMHPSGRFRNISTLIFLPAHPEIRFSTLVILDQAIKRLYDLLPGLTLVGEGAQHERSHKLLRLRATNDCAGRLNPPI